MASKKQIELETKLIKLGFKRRWLDDKSGYWFEKKVKCNDLQLNFVVEPDHKLFDIECRIYSPTYTNKKPGQYETIARLKCDEKTIANAIKKYRK